MKKPGIRELDMCEIGPALTGDAKALRQGGRSGAVHPEHQPANVAPEQALVREGLMREDLFVVVHDSS